MTSSLTRLRPVLRARLVPIHKSCQSRRAFAYPKEGVFQPNSPARGPPGAELPQTYGYGRQPFPGSSAPPQPSSEGPYSQFEQQSFHVTPDSVAAQSRPFVKWTGRIIRLGVYLIVFNFAFQYTQELTLESFSLPFEPGSEEDRETLKELESEYDDLHEVRLLRDVRFLKDGRLQPRYTEWVAYNGLNEMQDRRSTRFTTGPLRGSGGVAAQHIFFDQMTGAVINLINFGEATCHDIPGVVHNGVISTIFDETLGRVAIRSTEKNTAVTARLNVEFHDPCRPGQWYCIFAVPDNSQNNTETKKYVQAGMWCTGEYEPERSSVLLNYNGFQTIGARASSSAPSEDRQPWAFSSAKGDSMLRSVALQNNGEHSHASATALFVVPKQVELKRIVDEF